MLTRRSVMIGGACFAVACSTTSQSKRKKKGVSNSIELVGINAFDAVFTQARDIDKILDRARKQIRNGRTNLNSALGLTQGTPWADAVSQLQKKGGSKLRLASSGGGFKLQASDAVPNNVKSAVSAMNSTLGNYRTALTQMANLPKEIKQLNAAAAKFPDRIQRNYNNLGISAFELPQILSTTSNNLQMMSRFPKRVTKLSGDINSNLNVVRKLF